MIGEEMGGEILESLRRNNRDKVWECYRLIPIINSTYMAI